MNVILIKQPHLTEAFLKTLPTDIQLRLNSGVITHGQAIALTAIRTCYSPGKPSEIVAKEGAKYFCKQATDGEGGTEADRLFRMIVRSGHSSTVEHLDFTFAIEGVSRALLAQLTRHRVGFSYSVQSQRYVKFGSKDRSGGFEYVVPDTVENGKKTAKFTTQFGREVDSTPQEIFERAMNEVQYAYDLLREAGVPAEDARAVLPQASACNLVMTANLRAILEFYSKRQPGKGAQKEITDLAVALKDAVINVEPWTAQFFAA
jgi:thymidylate synthase (FAD)